MIEIACFCVGFLAGVIAAFAAMSKMDTAVTLERADEIAQRLEAQGKKQRP